ncbi:MAG: hypothetical protein HY077_19075 [Elusimicrobia bacterium]|nr:hypothetical protein [Elusimicrobiota bacterium]
MKKKDAAEKEQPKLPKSVEEMILNFPGGKYTAIPLAAQWAKVLRRREEHRHLTANEILDLALREVLGGEIDWKDLKKALSANGAAQTNGLNGLEEKAKDK